MIIKVVCILVYHLVIASSQISATKYGQCPWGMQNDWFVKCDKLGKSAGVRICYCLTTDPEENVLVGSCLYGCKTYVFRDIKVNSIYQQVLFNGTSDINMGSCSKFNRKGLMCGKCLEGHGYPAYSYNLSCVACKDYKYNWIRYLAAVYVPLTLFCIVIVVFRISANSGRLIGYVILSQMTSTYTLVQLYLVLNPDVAYTHWINFLAFVYSLWNMNLLRSVYPSFCLHPEMASLMVYSLDYVVAVYPLAAIILTYFAVQAFSYMRYLSSPVYKCFHGFKKELNIRHSLIEAFATLFLISHVKVLNVTSNILTYTVLYDSNGSLYEITVYNAPHVKYLGPKHRPFFILAIFMTIIFNVLPFVLICLYPMKFFQRAIHRCGLRCVALVTFMDAIQGSYKHKHYYRCFPGVFLFSLFLNSVIISTLGIEQYHAASSLHLLAIATLVAYFKPFKNNNHNRITVSLFGFLFCAHIGITFHLFGNAVLTVRIWILFLRILTYSGSIILPLYGVLMFIRMMIPLKLRKFLLKTINKIKVNHREETSCEDRSPYRYESSEETLPLLRQ